MTPIAAPFVVGGLAYGVRGIREASRPELMDKRLAYKKIFDDIEKINRAELTSSKFFVPYLKKNPAIEKIRCFVRIGKGEGGLEDREELEESLKYKPWFIDKLKAGLSKLNESENNATHLTSPLESREIRLTASALHNNSASQNIPSTTLQNQSSTSLNPNQNQQNQVR
jgi:hypothetical protein